MSQHKKYVMRDKEIDKKAYDVAMQESERRQLFQDKKSPVNAMWHNSMPLKNINLAQPGADPYSLNVKEQYVSTLPYLTFL